MQNESVYQHIHQWFKQKQWQAFPFQEKCWNAIEAAKHGLLNAPTGSGKTFALFIPFIAYCLRLKAEGKSIPKGVQIIWITPLRALAKDIQKAMEEVIEAFELTNDVQVARRTGDISAKEKAALRKQLPQVFITTPESLHLILAQKSYAAKLKKVRYVVVDEWHELLGSKRGVQVELALSRIQHIQPKVLRWGISATIGNMDEAVEVLVGTQIAPKQVEVVKASLDKKLQIRCIIPEEVDKFPWAGHLGLKLLPQLLPIIMEAQSTLVFTNTRAQSEIWFKALLDAEPMLAGQIALHHGSLDKEVREWVEWALHEQKLKAVVCTSSLDLGVDFSPVDQVVQIGSPKGIARFLQRAGRSGHRPGATSKMFFLPTHALELVEGAALRHAAENPATEVEKRQPLLNPLDVLVQYLITLAVSDGFKADELYREIKSCFAFQVLSEQDWNWALAFIQYGGKSLARYDDYQKVFLDEEDYYRISSIRMARRHRMQIGTITSESSMRIKLMSGGSLGSIEEYFISRLKEGDSFWFSGRSLELVRVKGMTAYVRKSKAKKGPIPSWLGGRISLSSQMSKILREKLQQTNQRLIKDPELQAIQPIIDIQKKWSIVPTEEQLLIEYTKSREGYHLFIFPFEGRYVHEGLSALIAYRMGKMKAISFSIAMNDYGFELLSDQPIPIQEALEQDIFSDKHLEEDIHSALNDSELAKRRFRDIARVAGLIFNGFPGDRKKNRQLQMSSSLLFDVFSDIEPDHRLIQQAYDEVLQFQLDETRLRQALIRIQHQKIVFKETPKSSPFAFPIMVDRLREKMSSEKLADRIAKLTAQLEKAASKKI